MSAKRYSTRSKAAKVQTTDEESSSSSPPPKKLRSRGKSRKYTSPAKKYSTRVPKKGTIIELDSDSFEEHLIDLMDSSDSKSDTEVTRPKPKVKKVIISSESELAACIMCKSENFETCHVCRADLCLFCDERLQDMSEYVPPAKKTSHSTKWSCFNCHHFDGDLDSILTHKIGDDKSCFVTWKGRSYHDASWTHVAWLENKSPLKVKFFRERMSELEKAPEAQDLIESEWLIPELILDVEFKNPNGIQSASLKSISEVLVKWCGVSFDKSSWEPFVPSHKIYNELIPLAEKYLRSLCIPPPQKVTEEHLKFAELKSQPSFISGGTLYPYQLDGLNWLHYQWCNRKSAILADEMGLGKTIQLICFLNMIYLKANSFPFLIVVPKAVISNWFREFSVWAPDLIVATYTGGKDERSLVRDSGLFTLNGQLRAHVLLTTYNTISSDTRVFSNVKSWEVLIIDEGQRLKNSGTLGFRKINSINANHRILLTGTPLQNNLNELFSLMSFMDPQSFKSEEDFMEKYQELDQASVAELHELLKPYFLRRTKDNVLKDLPIKIEVTVPVSMTPLQKELYKAALSRDIGLLQSIAPGRTILDQPVKRKNLVNIFMELRKLLNHPYLIPGVEPDDGASQEEIHHRLIESCAKLRLLHRILKNLKANGHRVLIFSQFKLVLDIIEDYFDGEGVSFFRIDGEIATEKRQSMIDQFNKKDSEVFAFLLTTRAGGVGMNLASADTVIIYDIDFNPHSDLQALARAHRIGQLKKVLVLRMITRSTIEERMFEIAKRKMVLDHLIVQQMGEVTLDEKDIQSIIRFGAKALFEEDSSAREITYTDQELDSLLDRSGQATQSSQNEHGEAFGFSRLWTSADPTDQEQQVTDAFWSNLLKERLAEKAIPEQLGRGARRRTSRIITKAVEWTDSDESSSLKKAKNQQRRSVPNDDDYVYGSSPQVSSDIDLEVSPQRNLPSKNSVVDLTQNRSHPPPQLKMKLGPSHRLALPQTPGVSAIPTPVSQLSYMGNFSQHQPLPEVTAQPFPQKPSPVVYSTLSPPPANQNDYRSGYYCTWCAANHTTQCPMYTFNLDVQVLKQKINGQPELLRDPYYTLFSSWGTAQARLPPYTGPAPSQAQIQSSFPDARYTIPTKKPSI